MQKIHEVEPAEIKKWLDNHEILLIDVREVEEYNDAYIPGALLYPTSSFNPKEIPNTQGQKIVFHCKAGKRSANAAVKWADFYGAPDVYSMKGGIDAWKEKGFATESNQATANTIRQQTYIWSGILILAGTLLAAWLSAWFLLLPALAGMILVYTGVAGTSYLAYIISKLRKKK